MYAVSSLDTKSSHLSIFFQFCESRNIDNQRISVGELREFGLHLALEEIDANVATQYLRTVIDYLIIKQFLVGSVWGETTIAILTRHTKLMCKRHNPKKALPLTLEDVASLPPRLKSLLVFWISSGLRMSSIVALKPEFMTKCSSYISMVLPSLKADPSSGTPIYKCYCACPSSDCFVHHSSLPHFPIDSKDISLIRELSGASFHSPRRTLAISLRILKEVHGYRISVARVNTLFFWSPRSKMWFEYSKDWAAFTGCNFLFFRGVLSQVLLSRSEVEEFSVTKGFSVRSAVSP